MSHNDDGVQSDRDYRRDGDDQIEYDAEEETLVDGGKATYDGEAATDIVEEAENEDVEGTGIVDEMVNLADDENGCEEGPSHLSVNDENDHE